MGFFSAFKEKASSCFSGSSSGYASVEGDALSCSEKTAVAINAVDTAKPFLALAYALRSFMVNEKEKNIDLSIGMLMFFETTHALQSLKAVFLAQDRYDVAINSLLCLKSILADVALGIAAEGSHPDLPPQLFCAVFAMLFAAEAANAWKNWANASIRCGHTLKAGLFAVAGSSLGLGLVGHVATKVAGWTGIAALGGLFAKTVHEKCTAPSAPESSASSLSLQRK